MVRVSRRSMLLGGAGAVLAAATPGRAGVQVNRSWDVVVIGAGVFGAWTAVHLRRRGRKVLLLDAWGPAHARASSGGETRMTRGAYGRDEVYTRMATDSLSEWQGLSARAELPLFHRTGVLFFFSRVEPYLEDSVAVHRRLGLSTELLDRRALRRRFPQFDFGDIETGLFEPGFGALMARRAVQTLVAEYVREGGTYLQDAVLPPEPRPGVLAEIRTSAGERVRAERFVFACGPWLPRLFPDELGTRIFPTRQEVFFFSPPAGDRRFLPSHLPGWADFNGGDIYYGFADIEGRGFKIAHDAHGERMDPDSGDRAPSARGLADVRNYMERRFPAMAGRPLSEARVCQYENSSNGDLLIDFHPAHPDVLFVGAGSGHGFKHGPEVGRYAAALLAGDHSGIEPRFSLAAKGDTQSRDVH